MLELEELSEALKRAADEPQSFQGFLLVKQRTTRLTKRGDPFLQLTLVDAEAAVTSVVFSDHSAYEILRDPETGFIAVRGVLENIP